MLYLLSAVGDIRIGVCFPESSEIFIQNWYYANYWSSKFKLLVFVYIFLIIHYNLNNTEFIKCQSEGYGKGTK